MALSLTEQVAQRLILGYEGSDFQNPKNQVFQRFLAQGLGGVIFFRNNFQEIQRVLSPQEIVQQHCQINGSQPDHCPPLFLSLDQEGGPVERLPYTIFPSIISPQAIALSQKESPETIAYSVYSVLGQYLSLLGFNMNFCPVLDVNTEDKNPVIGVRSFGQDSKRVEQLGRVAFERMEHHGILAVGKHFPGHGSSGVDSHETMPTLNISQEHLSPFQAMIRLGIPALMVSHGYYPELQKNEESTPASASEQIIQGMLREKLGYTGLILTDDMVMGAITQNCSPIEAALASIKAGADILIYRQSTETEWAILQAIVEALKTGVLDRQAHENSLERILAIKKHLKPLRQTRLENSLTENDLTTWSHYFQPTQVQQISESMAQKAISVIMGKVHERLPLERDVTTLLLFPDRNEMSQYAHDVHISPDLTHYFHLLGFTHLLSRTYRPEKGFSIEALELPDEIEPQQMVLLTWNHACYPSQIKGLSALKARYPKARLVVASVGNPTPIAELDAKDLFIGLCSYRPPVIKAFSEFLVRPE